MAQRWSARVRAGAGMRWQRMWRTAATNDRVPPGIALPTIAEHLAAEFGPDRVHVVLADDATATVALVGEILGVQTGPLTTRHDVLGTDLLRRVNPVLGLSVGDVARREIVDRVWPEISVEEASGPLGAPAGQLDWAVRDRRADGHRAERWSLRCPRRSGARGADPPPRRTTCA